MINMVKRHKLKNTFDFPEESVKLMLTSGVILLEMSMMLTSPVITWGRTPVKDLGSSMFKGSRSRARFL